MRESSKESAAAPCRSLPHRRPFVVAMLISAVQYLAIISAATFAFILIREKSAPIITGFAVSVAVIMLAWVFGFLQRRSARCPLCKGTPLLDHPASKHRKARRLPPFNYGTTALLAILLTHRFRCMYCGTPFDLLKKRKFVAPD